MYYFHLKSKSLIASMTNINKHFSLPFIWCDFFRVLQIFSPLPAETSATCGPTRHTTHDIKVIFRQLMFL